MKPIYSRSAQTLLLLIGSLFFLPADAAPVTVGDPSFEGNTLTAGGYAFDLSPEWTGTGGSNNGGAFEEYITGFSAAGTDHLGMENGYDVWQDIGTYQANTAYTLTVAAGNRSGNTQAGNLSQYLLADSTGAIYATGTFDASTLAAQTFADAPALVFSTPTNPAAIGKPLRILLRARGNGRSHFDNIRLDATSTAIPGAAAVGSLAATNLTAATATLNGAVTNIGNDAPAITLFWGTTNGNANPGEWTNSANLPGTHNGGFSTNITGLSPATTYYFTARATNSAGASWALPTESFETLAAAPGVANTPATNLRATTATLGANVTATGGENPTVTIYYGTSDGGTTPGAWAHSTSAGNGSGSLSAFVSGLDSLTTYYFRAFAQNSGGTAWAPASASFATVSVTFPVVENRSAEGITGTTVNLRGEVMDTGNDTPTVTLFYGTSDGGTTPGTWAASANHGLQSGEFTRFVANLSANTIYFFRWRAVNAAGTAWSPETGTFTTTGLVPSTAVVNEFHYNYEDPTSIEEFIELHNPGDSTIDLSGWTLSDAVTYTFPPGTTLPAQAYRVIAQVPGVVQTKFGISGVLGPWTGSLSSIGESIDLRDASGLLKDRVNYRAGFPWPTSADGAGSSAELIHPGLDNDLGGSWRSSIKPGLPAQTFIAPSTSGWRYKKATAEASSPVDAWRAIAFNDSAWSQGTSPIGMGTSITNTTVLSDMLATGGASLNYRTVYGRRAFTVPASQIPDTLILKVRIDDGCVVWINGTEVYRIRVNTGQLPYNTSATSGVSTATWATINLTGTAAYLKGGTNTLAIHAINRDSTNNRGDFTFDADLSSTPTVTSYIPTPGASNSSLQAVNLVPPAIRQVAHTPNQPAPNQAVTVTARITDPDGMGAVSLAYQLVDPGNYIRLTDAAYQTSWTTVTMTDTGTNGDALAGDSTFTAVLPGPLQTNRRLVRYRISFADSLGNPQTVPYADDEQQNFAYYVYSALPAWQGAFRPGTTPLQTFPSTVLDDLPVYSLIANGTDVIDSQYVGSYEAVRFRGTFVYNGTVYDHIEFKNRGEASTYVSGKNKWRFFFNRSRDLPASSNFGKKYSETWGSFSGDACASPWAALHRGMAGVEEAASYKIFQLGGLPSPNTHYYHFRVVRGANETPAAGSTVSDPIGNADGQYAGDFWGLYLAVEQPDGSFLDERGLPDGNIYKIEGNAGDKKHQAANQVLDSSDWDTFRDAHLNADPTESWWRANMDMDAYYTFHALNRLIGNVDVRGGFNHYFHHRSTDNRWVPMPWDLDMMFIAKSHWSTSISGINYPGVINAHKTILQHPALALEYRNRAREILSLLASDATPGGGQIGQLLDEFSQMINPAGQPVTWADADAAMWNLHPRSQGTDSAASGQTNHKGNFYRTSFQDSRFGGTWNRWLRSPASSGTMEHEDTIVFLRDYATNTWPGGTWTANNGNQLGYGYQYLAAEAADANVPAKPTLTSTGASGFPVNDLSFSASAFNDPQGPATYVATHWRLAEIQGPGVSGWTSGTPRKYEINAILDSGTVGTAQNFTIPLGVAEPGKTYRVRARHKDTTGNWSYWSDPVQFGATAAPPGALIHYWNFNDTTNLLTPTQTIGGGALGVTGTYLSGTGEGFAALNARNGDFAITHLRVNNPLTAGTMVTTAIPTGGFENIIVKYETRRSAQGAGLQHVSYTLDGINYTPFAAFTILDATPVVRTLDFRALTGAADNPLFGIRITFLQGDGGTSGNNRFDNLTVEADPLPGLPELIPGGDADWNIASNWASASVPNGTEALAIIGAPATANRAVTLTAPVTIRTLEMDNAASGLLNQISGSAGITLTFNGGASPALLDVKGTAAGFIEFDVPGGTILATDLRLDVSNIGGDPAHGALRLRETWSGPGGLIKQGLGIASLTGMGKTFAGAVSIEEGVLQISQPATPGQTSGITVHPGGQLRLTSGNDVSGERIHTFGGAISLAGNGRGAGVPSGDPYGVAGALRYEPDVPGINRAVVTNTVTLSADSTIHTTGPDNTLVLSGTLVGTHALTKSGDGTLVLSGTSPAFTGPVVVALGTLDANGNLSATPLQLAPGTLLRGSGTTGPITGSGTVSPHLTTLTAPSSAAPNCDFVLANTGAAGNSLLRLTDSAPFPIAPATVDLFVNIASRAPGDRVSGGFFTVPSFDLAAALGSAQVRLLVPDAGGSISHLGLNYRVAIPADQLTWSVVDRSADFGSGMVAGRTIEISVGGVPTAFTQWRNLFFPNPEDLANDAISGPNANPSGDGVANLIRYAHGVGPFDPVVQLLPALMKNGSGFDFRFRYDATKTDLIWRVKATNDLSDWPSVLFDSQTTLPIPPLVDGWLPVTLPAYLGAGPATDPEMFTRLEIRLVTP